MNISSNSVLSALFIYAPQFYTVDTNVLAGYNTLYNLTITQVNPQVLSCNGVQAMAFLMAHYLTIAAQPNTGVESAMNEGQLGIHYNVASDMDALDMTPYGRSYKDLIKRTVIGSTVTNLPVLLGGIIQNIPTGPGCCGGWGYGFGNAGCGCGGGC